MPKIAYIDPVGPEAATPIILDEFNKVKNNSDVVEFFHLDRGPQHLEYRYYEALIDNTRSIKSDKKTRR